MAWDIQYENDLRPSLRVCGDREKAERIAKKRNKYNESFTVTEAPKQNYELEKELAIDEARKYGLGSNLKGW